MWYLQEVNQSYNDTKNSPTYLLFTLRILLFLNKIQFHFGSTEPKKVAV